MRLEAIFEAAKPNRESKKLTPQNEEDNNAPQRVQTTVAPPRVESQDPDQMSIQHIISPHSTPNSHRKNQHLAEE
jgi:hypothetical protein